MGWLTQIRYNYETRFIVVRYRDNKVYIYFFVYYMTLQAYAKFSMKNKKFWPILGFSP